MNVRWMDGLRDGLRDVWTLRVSLLRVDVFEVMLGNHGDETPASLPVDL